MKKQILFLIVASSLMTTVSMASEQKQQPSVFDNGNETRVNGNQLWMWMRVGRYQSNPSPEFEKTFVVQYSKDGRYVEKFQLDEVEKSYHPSDYERTPLQREKVRQWDKFDRHAKANNAVVCPNIMQLPNRDGELKDVAVIIYGTQNTTHCERYQQWLRNAGRGTTPVITAQEPKGAFGGFFDGLYKLASGK